MKKFVLLMAALLITAAAGAQDEPLVSVYLCDDGGECSHAPTSQEWTTEEAELLLGEPAPAAGASVVCSAESACTWTALDESEIELTLGGDGTIAAFDALDVEGYLKEIMEFDFDALADAEADESGATAGEPRYWVVICEGENCRIARTRVLQSQAELMTGEEAPGGSVFVLCEADGCVWQEWTQYIQPLDGPWLLETHAPKANNCPEGSTPISQLVTSGERDAVFSKPVAALDIFTAAVGGFDRVQQANPALNNYVLSLGVGTGQFASQVIYDWTVVQETFIAGNIVIDLPSIFGGRCTVYIPWEMRYQG